MNLIQKHLFALQDSSYRVFQSKLMPTVDPNRIIGVRMPALRQYAKEIAAEQPTATAFLAQLRTSIMKKTICTGC